MTFGTHYTPIAAPSIVASLFIFVPLLVVAKKAREQEKKIFFLEEALREARQIQNLEKDAHRACE